jgi:hypothetical protein
MWREQLAFDIWAANSISVTSTSNDSTLTLQLRKLA